MGGFFGVASSGFGAYGAYRPMSFNGFSGVKFPFDVLYKFKSIDRYGKVLDANR